MIMITSDRLYTDRSIEYLTVCADLERKRLSNN